MTIEKKRTRTITGWRQVHRKPGISSRRLPAPPRPPAPPPLSTILETRSAPSDPAANEGWENEGGSA